MYDFLVCQAIKAIKALLYVMLSTQKAIKAIKALLYVCLLYAALTTSQPDDLFADSKSCLRVEILRRSSRHGACVAAKTAAVIDDLEARLVLSRLPLPPCLTHLIFDYWKNRGDYTSCSAVAWDSR